ncbi:hypothetical protein F130042H8_29020 [Enterocloster alcoholdehydrogenati]|uniref:Uncharacterized protein n=1 Tax=Enterocloster alcoholdehydrogenati TaxID=2547410 RepID=A0ABQ0B0R7_9FIRM
MFFKIKDFMESYISNLFQKENIWDKSDISYVFPKDVLKLAEKGGFLFLMYFKRDMRLISISK